MSTVDPVLSSSTSPNAFPNHVADAAASVNEVPAPHLDAEVHAVLDSLAEIDAPVADASPSHTTQQVEALGPDDAVVPASLAAFLEDSATSADEPESSLTFAQLGVPADLVAELEQLGILSPFPVQAATLPDALAGLDVCGQAPTGSGKTLAYGLAVMARVGEGMPRRPKALILVPVRELAEQVTRALVPFGRSRRRWVQALVGGQDIYRQIDALRRGVAVAVATPGRMFDLVNRGEADLSGVEIVVIDEADRMGDMGFMPQVRDLLDEIKGTPQVLLFSATLDGDVGELIKQYQKDPVHHSAEGIAGSLDEDGLAGEHLRVGVRHDNKLQVAAALAEPTRKTLVFVKNRFATERTADQISDLGVPATHLHGGLTQSGRARALRAWTSGEVKVLVATDLVARGLHVDGVDLVLHLDPPQDIKDYVHRSGRTGRAGAAGTVVNLLRKEQRKGAYAMERRLGVEARDAEIGEVIERLVAQVAEAQVAEAAEAARQAELRKDRPQPANRDRNDRGPRGREGGGSYGRPRNDGDRGGRPSYADRNRAGGSGFERIGDRPGYGDRPTGDRSSYSDRISYGDRPRTDRPATDRPAADRPWAADRQRADRPAGDRPSYGERPAYSDRPRTDRPAADRPWSDRPRTERPAGDRPTYSDRPRTDRPAADRPWSDRPRTERPAGDRPSYGERPAYSDRPRTDRPAADRPWSDRPRTERPAGDRPSYGRPAPRDGVTRSFSPSDDRPAWANPPRPAGPRGPKPGGAAKPWSSR